MPTRAKGSDLAYLRHVADNLATRSRYLLHWLEAAGEADFDLNRIRRCFASMKLDMYTLSQELPRLYEILNRTEE